jgi:hypothetical protein
MGLVDDAKRIKTGIDLDNWTKNLMNRIDEVDKLIQEISNLKTEYPDDAVEVQSYIDNAKTALESVVAKVNKD